MKNIEKPSPALDADPLQETGDPPGREDHTGRAHRSWLLGLPPAVKFSKNGDQSVINACRRMPLNLDQLT